MQKQALITLIGFTAQLLVSLGASILAARLLGPQGRGELAALLMLPQMLPLLTAAGMPQALTYFTAHSPRQSGQWLGSALALSTVLCIPAAVLGIALIPHLLAQYSPQIHHQAMLTLLILLPLFSVLGLPSNTLLGGQHYVWFNIVRIAGAGAYLAAAAVAWVAPQPFTLAITYAALFTGFTLPPLLYAYHRHVHQPLALSWQALRRMETYAWYTWLSTLPQAIAQRLDQLFVLVQLPAAALGHYSIALGLGQMLLTLQSAAGTLLLPKLAAQGQTPTAQRHLFGRLIRTTILLSAACTAGGLITLPYLLPFLFSAAFTDAISPAAYILTGFAIMGINSAFSDGFRGLGWARLPLWTELLTLGTKVATFAALGFQVTLTTAALIALIGPALTLLLNLHLFHTRVQPLNTQWFTAFKADTQTLLHTAQRVLKMKG